LKLSEDIVAAGKVRKLGLGKGVWGIEEAAVEDLRVVANDEGDD
jgi:hypothetical protein